MNPRHRRNPSDEQSISKKLQYFKFYSIKYNNFKYNNLKLEILIYNIHTQLHKF